ncbi:DUF6879 family protein [Allosalinactinospora lopnorensis]|uniref:DUF6879 family protein n=1 Tax=Allosalinactinospora lopnorensis TaxID=1352348 RepID=UPI0006962E11|nr:DUF6879 family protein [Allosalinactinospora lopnorensis]
MSENPKGRPITWDEVEQLFAEFRYTAFRLETLQIYAADYENEDFRRFIADEQQSLPPTLSDTEWGEEVRSGIAAGRRYDRVHVVTEPLSDYVRFECAHGYRRNVAAGENIRILPAEEGDWPSGLPHLDYWLFDSHQMLWMNYADDGSLLTTELIDDPEWVVAANVWRDRAIHLSVPFTEYDAQFDAYMRRR